MLNNIVLDGRSRQKERAIITTERNIRYYTIKHKKGDIRYEEGQREET